MRLPVRLDQILFVDAATCAAMGTALVVASGYLSRMTAIPASLLFWAGLGLLPLAAYMVVVGRRWPDRPLAVRPVVAGNVAWVAGSIALLAVIAPNALGVALILGQAAAVAALALLEHAAFRHAGQLA
jgi:hypothetical protein